MTLPDLQDQTNYARLSWGIVLAGTLMFVARRFDPRTIRGRVTLAAAVAVGVGTMWLPEKWSPAFWLRAAFQSPSLLTCILIAMFVSRSSWGWPELGLGQTMVHSTSISLMGLALGVSTFGLVDVDLYAVGLRPWFAAATASLLVGIWWLFGDRRSAWPIAMALAAALFGATRLPTGNAWDALLDPFVIVFSFASLIVGGWRCIRERATLRDAHDRS